MSNQRQIPNHNFIPLQEQNPKIQNQNIISNTIYNTYLMRLY